MTDTPDTKQQSKSTRSQSTIKVISVIAILVAIAAIGVAIYVWNLSSHTDYQLNMNQNTNKASVGARINDINGNLQNQQQRLDTTNDNVVRLMKSIGNPERPQALSQISYLINIASLQLSLNKDTKAAIHYLTIAKQRANNMADPGLTELKRSLDNDLNKLRATPQFDKTTIIIQLDNINSDIEKLSIIPDLKQQVTIHNPDIDNNKNQKWYNRFWYSIKSLKELVIIRHSDINMKPLLTKDQEQLLKERIASKINQTEWAVLNHDNNLYQHNITEINTWLSQYFHDANNIDAIKSALDDLTKINVAPITPNINDSLSAIGDALENTADFPPVKKQKNTIVAPTKPGKQPINNNPNAGVAL